MKFRVRVTPRSGRNEIAGVRDDGVLLIRVTAPPDGGKANEAVRRLIAKTVGIAPSRVAISRGETAREKTISIDVEDTMEAGRALGLPRE